MAHKVILTLPLPEEAVFPLRERFELVAWTQPGPIPEATLLDWVQVSDAILCSVGTPVPASVMAAGTGLKVISSISVGVDHIAVDAATERGIPIGHTPGVLVDSTADMALALMLSVTRRTAEADAFIREGGWQAGWSTGFFLGSDISGATVGIVGLGAIGQAVARRLQGFGARVIAWNRSPKNIPGIEMVELDSLIEQSDIVTLHAAATPDTHHLMSAGRLAAMKEGAVLINTARGSLVDEAALAAELQTGRLRAGLDVFEAEPLPLDSPLLGLKNAVLAPHLGSATGATRQAMMERALTNLVAGLSGETLPFCANPEVYR